MDLHSSGECINDKNCIFGNLAEKLGWGGYIIHISLTTIK